MKRGFWVCFILTLVFVNGLSAEPVKTKKVSKKQESPARNVAEDLDTAESENTTLEKTTQQPPTGNKNSSEMIAQPRFAPRKKRSSLRWNRFQVGGGTMFDSDGGNAGALSLTWNPTYLLAPSVSLKGYMGGLMGNLFAGSVFGIGDLGLTLKYYLSDTISFEAGGGMQYWAGTRHKHLFPQIKAGLGFERFIITYASVFDSLLTTHQVLGAVYIEF
jgi:hypothetical protein